VIAALAPSGREKDVLLDPLAGAALRSLLQLPRNASGASTSHPTRCIGASVRFAGVVHLDEDMKRVVREQSLGFVATVCPDGTPNLSPKGTTMVWDDEHLAFLHLYSPGTVANLEANPAMEVNVVDPLLRKGYRFKGRAEVFTSGPEHDAMLERVVRERGTDPSRVRAIVLLRVDAAAPLISPAYEMGETETSLTTRWLDHFTGLAARTLPR
jgi:hypothetical protein